MPDPPSGSYLSDQKTLTNVSLPSPVTTSWALLASPGLPLRNSLNKCWFHAALHLLTVIPPLRAKCESITRTRTFENRFLAAVRAIYFTRQRNAVDSFFPLVRDFTGLNNRYGQVAVPDFIDHLCLKSPILSSLLKFNFLSKLVCSKCQWVSERMTNDISSWRPYPCASY